MNANSPLHQTVRVLTEVIDATDPHTRGRSERLARWTLAVARDLGVPAADWPALEMGALLHDLGRYALLNDVVQTPRALEPGERALVQTHPTVGYEMLKGIPGLEAAAEIVLAHHERPDGKGYPRGLSGDDVPMGARIIMVCAAYDAMTEERPYRHGLPPKAACDELRRHAGTQFYPEIVDAFVRLQASGAIGDGPGAAAQRYVA